MISGLKERSCKRRVCKKPYTPKVEWQKYCSDACRDAVAGEKKAAMLREYKKLLAAQAEAS